MKVNFECHTVPFTKIRYWQDDENTPIRVIVERLPNRFQAFEKLDGKFLSIGYPLTRVDIRKFLMGQASDMYPGEEFPDDLEFVHPDRVRSQRPWHGPPLKEAHEQPSNT